MVNPMMFPQFMQQMRGKDPQQLLNQMIANGQLNQNQLNQAQQQARQMADVFNQFRGMFGFN